MVSLFRRRIRKLTFILVIMGIRRVNLIFIMELACDLAWMFIVMKMIVVDFAFIFERDLGVSM